MWWKLKRYFSNKKNRQLTSIYTDENPRLKFKIMVGMSSEKLEEVKRYLDILLFMRDSENVSEIFME